MTDALLHLGFRRAGQPTRWYSMARHSYLLPSRVVLAGQASPTQRLEAGPTRLFSKAPHTHASTRTGGDSWATYDRLFREHAALDKSRRLDWTTLDLGLHQATFMRQASYGGKICSHCRETDHADHECALASVKDQGSDRRPSPPAIEEGAPLPFQDLAAPGDPGEHLHLLEPGELHFQP